MRPRRPEREPHAHPRCAAAPPPHQRGDVRAREQQDHQEHHQHARWAWRTPVARDRPRLPSRNTSVGRYAGANRHDRAENRGELRVERRLRRANRSTPGSRGRDDEAAGRRIRERVPAVEAGVSERRFASVTMTPASPKQLLPAR